MYKFYSTSYNIICLIWPLNELLQQSSFISNKNLAGVRVICYKNSLYFINSLILLRPLNYLKTQMLTEGTTNKRNKTTQ